MASYSVLDKIEYPEDLRKLKKEDLYTLANEVREFILTTISSVGGHLASNLGTVELSIVLHYIYNTPADKIIWDVGHQSYAHKILTGRKSKIAEIRTINGIAGFPKRDESEYDEFGVGHSSTSISAALGMAIANKIKKKDSNVVAVIGDGAMTAGLAFEALNNTGWLQPNLLVILNDNEMSISENVGAITKYFSSILTSRFYNTVKGTANKAFDFIPPMRRFAHKIEEHVKGMIIPSTLFEELGFNYIGPIDGHDIDELYDTLINIKQLKGPQFLHIVTKKGYGYKLAENSPIEYHGVSKFNPEEGIKKVRNNDIMSYTQVFGKWLCDLAVIDSNFIAITPAMREGSGMVEFANKFPDRFFDVGIAEQHSLTFAAGLATQGIKVVVAIYSTFLQRAYDQLIHDIALQNLPVILAVDRAGVVGGDGPTHTGSFDISFVRCIPNMVIMVPSDENECYQMLMTAYKINRPTMVRYPKSFGIGVTINENEPSIEVGKGSIIRNGHYIAILVFGTLLHESMVVADKLNATLCNMRFVTPLDTNLLQEVIKTHKYIVTIEENVVQGGAGSACNEFLVKIDHNCSILNIGINDGFVAHGDQQTLLDRLGLNSHGILKTIINKWGELNEIKFK